jgi:hypothetical protein
VINRPKAKKERIAFAPMNIRFSSDARAAPRLPSSDDGLFLATSTLRRLEEDVRQFGDFCALDVRAEDRDEQSISHVGAFRRAGEIVSKGELIEKV